MRHYLVTFLFLFLSLLSFAQTATIQGTISDANEQLAFVNILVEGTDLGAVTDETGNYQIDNVPFGAVSYTHLTLPTTPYV